MIGKDKNGTWLRRMMWRVANVSFATFSISTASCAAPWLLENSDSPKQIADEQVVELEQLARNGDWNLKMEFAAAYLYETYYPKIYGCARLKHGFRCRAMAKRESAGKEFLQEIIDTTPVNEAMRIDIRTFQTNYAGTIRIGGADWDSIECRKAARYYKLALVNGKTCAARELADMARFGLCGPKDRAMQDHYDSIAVGCPTP